MLLRKKSSKKIIVKKFVAIKKTANFFANFQTTNSCSIKKKYVAEDLYKAEIKVEKNGKRKKLFNLLLLIFNFVVIIGIFVYYGLTSGIKKPSELFTIGIKWKNIIFALLFLLLTIALESSKFIHLIKKSTGKFRLKLSVETLLLGRYYDSVTPFSVGGEPFQIFYLNKNGVSGDKATSIPIVKHVFWSASFIILGISILISNAIKPVTNNIWILVVAIISLLANSLLITILIFFSISRKKAQVLIIKLLKFANKLHLIKNYKATFFKVIRFVKKYQKSMKSIASNFSTLFFQLFLGVSSYLATFTMVYFIYLAFPHSSAFTLSWSDFICCMMFCDLVSLMMPLPGGTGLAEFSFSAIFSSWFDVGVLPWALIVWRILTYFIYIILGAFVIVKNYKISKKSAIKHDNQKG